ncbi:asparaginase [Paenibacillus hamazuiensis]|uniref:asparaginase n=1 Tax=Paenibacillus hamazuiensis TaxID=2936508 RepID=UPI00200FFDE8|nr:asparaginase [Paenibacillus hamazuiensis]
MNVSNAVVHVLRGPVVESKHNGHIAVVDWQGRLLAHLGQYTHLTFARSTAKPLQSIPVVESGAAARTGMTQPEIALMCASHSGEPDHTEAARSILAKSGLTPDSLSCGVHEPWHRPTAEAMRLRGEKPTALHNNCSGKHAGMLALAACRGDSVAGYIRPEHPVQRRMRETVADMCGLSSEELAVGIDGCGVPVFGMPLWRLAYAFARLGRPDSLGPTRAEAAAAIVAAIRAYPRYIAGTGRFDTQLIEATRGRIVGKMGAEGVFALTVPDLGIGVAVKIEDGAERALYPTVVETLFQLGLLDEAEQKRLQSFRTPANTNWQGMQVGGLLPVFQLHRQE